jgi:putative two-component system response regulator
VAQRTTLLIVEDEPVALQVLQLVLGSSGAYTVLTAGTITRALALAYEHHPALIISDRYLAEEDGLDLCRTVKSDPALRDTMFVLLTAAADTAAKVSGLDAGADEYLTKPYNDEELLSRVRAMLRIKALQDDLRRDKGELERLNGTLNESVQGITRLLTNIIHMRVPNALERSRRAYDLAHWMGVRLELENSTRDLLDLAAQIHEIGKISFPDDLLTRPAADLSPEDRDTLHHFPVFGQMIVGNVPQLKLVGRMLRHQLENIDGTGLPDRLMGKEIPITARVLRIVNVLDDLTGTTTVDAETLIEQLRALRGTVLDAHLVTLTEEFIRTIGDPEWMVGKKQIAVMEIREGMTIAADICTSSGLKLLPRDSRLTATHVDRIQSHHRSDPIVNGVFVYA